MEILENERINISKLISYYEERIEKEKLNRERVMGFYDDEKSFNDLMNRIIDKDYKKLESLDAEGYSPCPWNVMTTILDIVQHEGREIQPYDVLTRTYQSRTHEYMGWTFSMVHGEDTLVSIYNQEDVLVYRF
jgi:hypothetical protein